MIEIKVPTIGESITEATIAKWLKKNGEYVERDEVIGELESEKASFELNAEESGTLSLKAQEGDTVKVGQVIASIDESAAAPEAGAAKEEAAPKPAAEPPAAAPASPAPETSPEPQAAPAPAGQGTLELKVPTVGESIQEVTLLAWKKEEGAYVKRDEVVCELESEKATFELNAEEAGALHRVAAEGETLAIGALVATIDTSAAAPAGEAAASGQPSGEKTPEVHISVEMPEKEEAPAQAAVKATPVAAAMMTDKKVDPATVKGSGPQGKISKRDVFAALEHPGTSPGQALFSRNERREKLSNLRKTISRRLVEAKNATAMLTTFNEVDMTRIMEIRKQFKDTFKEAHGIGLGFMSFFTKACCFALQEWPAVNAYLDGDALIYHDYCDISIAVSSPRGLVVPVIRNAESLDMAGIEKQVAELAKKARDSKLTIEEMSGGTFTITNGGVFGSLLSTPILNIPQSAILGMHKIEERPIALNGQVVIRPMMYVALSYDHRVIDGKESVSFLARVKALLEHPEQLLIGGDPVKALLRLD